MPRPPRPVTAPRRQPVQARSTQLVADILKAAIRVLEREGAHRFTTIRVAEAAGVSVGSLYQYFPNKQAILFRLQLHEWEKTGETIDTILGDEKLPPARRLRTMLRAFFHSECEEPAVTAILHTPDGARNRPIRTIASVAPRRRPGVRSPRCPTTRPKHGVTP